MIMMRADLIPYSSVRRTGYQHEVTLTFPLMRLPQLAAAPASTSIHGVPGTVPQIVLLVMLLLRGTHGSLARMTARAGKAPIHTALVL